MEFINRREIDDFLGRLSDAEIREIVTNYSNFDRLTIVYNVADIQKIFKCNRKYAIAIMETKGFPTFYINDKKMVEKSEFEKWLSKLKGKAVSLNV